MKVYSSTSAVWAFILVNGCEVIFLKNSFSSVRMSPWPASKCPFASLVLYMIVLIISLPAGGCCWSCELQDDLLYCLQLLLFQKIHAIMAMVQCTMKPSLHHRLWCLMLECSTIVPWINCL